MPPGSQIPVDRTQPALDLDLLLSGLKPVGSGAEPGGRQRAQCVAGAGVPGPGGHPRFPVGQDVVVHQHVGGQQSDLSEQLIDNLNTALGTIADDGEQFSSTVDRLEKLITGLSRDRDPIGTAIASLDNGTASIADLLTQARPPLAGTIDQLSRLAVGLDEKKSFLDGALQRSPGNYRKLARIGAYGSFVQYYICELRIRVTDLQGRASEFPFIKQENGRCAEP